MILILTLSWQSGSQLLQLIRRQLAIVQLNVQTHAIVTVPMLGNQPANIPTLIL